MTSSSRAKRNDDEKTGHRDNNETVTQMSRSSVNWVTKEQTTEGGSEGFKPEVTPPLLNGSYSVKCCNKNKTKSGENGDQERPTDELKSGEKQYASKQLVHSAPLPPKVLPSPVESKEKVEEFVVDEKEKMSENIGSNRTIRDKDDGRVIKGDNPGHESPSPLPLAPVRICQEQSMAGHRDASRRRALAALTVILATFTALWSPYFVVNLHLASIDRRRDEGAVPALLSSRTAWALELTTRWLGLSSAAVNVFVYGWMNRSIREKLSATAQELHRFLGHQLLGIKRPSDLDLEVGNEDFFEFLERTSTHGCRRRGADHCSPSPGTSSSLYSRGETV